MNRYKGLAFLFLIIIIVILVIVIYGTVSTGNNNDNKSKTLSEVEFLEQKIEMLLNQMNNIETRNYAVSVTEISQETKSQQSGGTTGDKGNSEEETNGGGSNDESSGSENGSTSESGKQQESTNTGNTQESEQSKKYELKPIGVLSSTEEINWDNVKSEVEILYTSIPTITLDLYALNVSQDNVLGFNKEFDNLTISTKAQNKQDTLKSLAKLYEYIPKFIQNTSDEDVKKVGVDTKKELFNAYSKLDEKNWIEIDQNIKQAIEKFSILLSNTSINSSTQYKISKVYVMLNELENAVLVQDESVFLIKYKNVLEEINNL